MYIILILAGLFGMGLHIKIFAEEFAVRHHVGDNLGLIAGVTEG